MNKLYLAGESFAGHYIPSLGTLIDEKNSKEGESINLKGIIIGNPTVQIICHDYKNVLYQLGIVDEKTRDELIVKRIELKTLVDGKDYTPASYKWDETLTTIYGVGIQDSLSILNEPKSTRKNPKIKFTLA